MPGIGLDIEGAIQQAPQSARQSISESLGGLAELKRDNISSALPPPAESGFAAQTLHRPFLTIDGFRSCRAKTRFKSPSSHRLMHETSILTALHASTSHVPLS
jgi:hypothetical protein